MTGTTPSSKESSASASESSSVAAAAYDINHNHIADAGSAESCHGGMGIVCPSITNAADGTDQTHINNSAEAEDIDQALQQTDSLKTHLLLLLVLVTFPKLVISILSDICQRLRQKNQSRI